MKRLLYLYPEEWTGRRARELHTLHTCVALARAGVSVTLVTGGGLKLADAVRAISGQEPPANLHVAEVSRKFGPIKSAGLLSGRFRQWLARQESFDAAFVIHLKAADILKGLDLPYWWEAHEIFAETPEPGTKRAHQLERQEGTVLRHAAGRIATSQALARALQDRFAASGEEMGFEVVPHGGPPPSESPLADPTGPLVYAGSLAGWKGLPLALETAADQGLPVKVIAENEEDWRRWVQEHLKPEAAQKIDWRPRVPANELREHLARCRAGLCPTVVASGSGRYSLPMKLFDYAGAGLPVVTSKLPSLEGLGTEGWCRQVEEPTSEAWRQALYECNDAPERSVLALDWAARHTWDARGQRLAEIIFPG